MRFISIRAYDNYINANLERSLLEEAGINCHIKDEFTVTIDPLLSPALGGMKLMVEERSVKKAVELLHESDRLYLETVDCPNCRHPSLVFVSITTRYDSLLGKIRSLLVNGQEQEVKQLYRCNNCGYEMAQLPAGL
ncbi:MAG: DUF2007 domain-containing protein [Chitinophagaceae bacterium]